MTTEKILAFLEVPGSECPAFLPDMTSSRKSRSVRDSPLDALPGSS